MTDYKPPTSNGIIGRKSTITSEFVRSLIPTLEPSRAEYEKALSILGQKEGQLECSYCGGGFTEWDHFQPVVQNRKPTGYISNIQNLGPSCGKCNQSKGNKHWKVWMFGSAKLSPKTRGIKDLNLRSEKLEVYEEWGKSNKIKFEDILTDQELKTHWSNLESIVVLMQEADAHADILKAKINNELTRSGT